MKILTEVSGLLGKHGCQWAKFRYLGIRKRSSERIAVLRCWSAGVLQSERGKRVGGWRFEGGGGRQNIKVQSWKSLGERKNELWAWNRLYEHGHETRARSSNAVCRPRSSVL